MACVGGQGAHKTTCMSTTSGRRRGAMCRRRLPEQGRALGPITGPLRQRSRCMCLEGPQVRGHDGLAPCVVDPPPVAVTLKASASCPSRPPSPIPTPQPASGVPVTLTNGLGMGCRQHHHDPQRPARVHAGDEGMDGSVVACSRDPARGSAGIWVRRVTRLSLLVWRTKHRCTALCILGHPLAVAPSGRTPSAHTIDVPPSNHTSC